MKKLCSILFLITFNLTLFCQNATDISESQANENAYFTSTPLNRLIQFENIKESKNYIEATIYCPKATRIFFYLQFQKSNSTAAYVEIDGIKERYTESVPTRSIDKTLSEGTHKFSIYLDGYSGRCLLYIASLGDGSYAGPDNMITVTSTK